jgi:hypothetical protein
MKDPTTSKLKPIRYGAILAAAISLIIMFIVLGKILKPETKNTVFGIILLLLSILNILYFLKSRQIVSLFVVGIIWGQALSYFLDYRDILLILPVGILYLFLFYYLSLDLKHQKRYRKILELAAYPVIETDNGFTERPFPMGEVQYTKSQLFGFAEYLKEQRIAFPYFEEERITMVLNDYTRFLFRGPLSERDTFISFYISGSVTVNIAKREYKKFRDELSFDQLCQSLGDLFKGLLDSYKKGEKNKILETLGIPKIGEAD